MASENKGPSVLRPCHFCTICTQVAVSSSYPDEISLSVEESNKLREKLGLKPLRVDNDEGEESGAQAPGTGGMATDVLLAPVLPNEKDVQNEVGANECATGTETSPNVLAQLWLQRAAPLQAPSPEREARDRKEAAAGQDTRRGQRRRGRQCHCLG